jgi:3-oxoacyl-[acyl-carrier protein] reductase
VTGAASGIGAATARVFAEAGASVALAWFHGDDHDVEPVRAAVEAAGSKCLVAEIDVTDPRQVDAVFASAVSELGSLDIVVANRASPARSSSRTSMTTRGSSSSTSI